MGTMCIKLFELIRALVCQREAGNSHDPQAVATKKHTDSILTFVSHVPREISSNCLSFNWQGGVIRCFITGTKCYSSDLPQGGLKVPCIFSSTKTCANLNHITSKCCKNPHL